MITVSTATAHENGSVVPGRGAPSYHARSCRPGRATTRATTGKRSGQAGYHYYPGREQALAWLSEARFDVVDEAFDQQDGWGYRHLLVKAR